MDPPVSALQQHLAKYRANDTKALTQLAIAVGQWVVGLYLYSNGYLPFLLYSAFQSLNLLHFFMIYHDVGHGSFFVSSQWNQWSEWLLQFVLMTPIDWSKKHKLHHQTSGDLTKGPSGWNDTIFFTVDEYFEESPIVRKIVRFIREPFVFFSVIPILNWCVKYRIPFIEMLDKANKSTNLQIVINSVTNTVGSGFVFWIVYKVFGYEALKAYVFGIYLAMVYGIMLFHLQHAYNPSFTTREGWNLKDSAFKGSSILTIPFFLKTWTMGIEYHHIHHYSTLVPGYLLQKCHEEAPKGLWEGTTVLGYGQMWESLSYVLYSEKDAKYVTFGEAALKRAPKGTANKKKT